MEKKSGRERQVTFAWPSCFSRPLDISVIKGNDFLFKPTFSNLLALSRRPTSKSSREVDVGEVE